MLGSQRGAKPDRAGQLVRGGRTQLERPVQRLAVASDHESPCRVGGKGRHPPVPQIDLVRAGEAPQGEPRERRPVRLDETERALEGLSARIVLEERIPGEPRAVARTEQGLEERDARREPQVAREVRDVPSDLEARPRADAAADPEVDPPVVVRIGGCHARRVQAAVALEVACQPVIPGTRSARHAQPVIPAQRRPERAALLERVELLDEILDTPPGRLGEEAARPGAVQAVGVVAIHSAEIRRPGCPLRSDPSRGVRFPARRTRASPLCVDQQHTGRRPRPVQRGARGPLHYFDRFDVLGVQVVEPERPGSNNAARDGREVVLRLVHPHAIDEYDGRTIADQRLHAAHTDARSHIRQSGAGHNQHARHAIGQEI